MELRNAKVYLNHNKHYDDPALDAIGECISSFEKPLSVKDLIEELKQFDENLPVVLHDSDNWTCKIVRADTRIISSFGTNKEIKAVELIYKDM